MADDIVTKELRHDGSSETIARLAAQRTKFRGAVTKLTSERDAANARIAKLEADVLEAGKTGGATRIAELEAQIKSNAHRAKFNELAKAAGVKPNAVEDLWEKSGYKADGAEPDEKAMTKAIEAQRTARDYLFGDPNAGGTTPAAGDDEEDDGAPEVKELEQPRPGPARGQGGQKKSTGSQTQFTDAQLRDPEWCFSNAGKLAAAAKAAGDLPISQVGSKFTIL
jgi:hypothetical protein